MNSNNMRRVVALLGTTAGIALARPAYAQCATSTASDGTTTLSCADTVTTNTTNNDPNNPSTTAYRQLLAGPVIATINSGRSITGLGLLIDVSLNNAITFTNNGSISNNIVGAGSPSNAIDLRSNGGLITYLGSGNARATGTQGAYALNISNTGGGINIGSASTPITGTLRGGTGAISTSTTGSGVTNAWINGGTFIDDQGQIALAFAGDADINVVTTGGSTLTGGMTLLSSAGAASLSTDARIDATGNILSAAIEVQGRTGATLTLAAGGSVLEAQRGINMQTSTGELRLTTAAGTTIRTTAASGFGVRLANGGGASAMIDLGGTIDSASTGLFSLGNSGATTITIREGASISGTNTGISLRSTTNPATVLNLGTITSPGIAATFTGTLRIGDGGTSGSISGNIVDDGALFFNRSDAVTYGGAISGAGNLTKQGAGVLTLTGASTFTGGTTVSAGTLLVNGSLTGGVTVANGARLGGTGSIGAATINGVLSPGGDGAIGTLTINGNLVFNAGSTFRVDIGNGVSDRVNVTGTAALGGGVAAFASNSVFTAGTYTILNAAGGVSGTFSPLTTQPSTGAQLTYDANNVFLTINAAPGTTQSFSTRETLVFNAPTVTTNRISAFSTQIIGRLVGGQPLYDQTFAAAFNSVSVQNALIAARAAITTAGGPGVIIGGVVRTASSTTSSASSATTYSLAAPGVMTPNVVTTVGPATIQIGVLSTCNVTSLPSATRPTCTTGGTSYTVGDNETNMNTITTTTYTINETRTDTITDTLRETYELTGQVAAVGTIHAQVQSGLFDLGGRLLRRLAGPLPEKAGWGEIYAFRINQGGTRNARGIAAGASLPLAPGLAFVFGVDHGMLDIDVPGARETGDVALTEGGVGLRFDSGRFFAALSATYGAGTANTRRTIIGDSRAGYDVRAAGVALDLGYAIETGGWTLRPIAGIDYVSIRTDGFTETDTLGLAVAGRTADRVRASAGMEAGRTWGKFQMTASARYLTIIDGGERIIPVAFAVAPGRLLDMTAPREPDTALVGARARFNLSSRASLWAAYDGRFGKGYTGHAGAAGLSIAW